MKILLLDIETAPNVAHVWGLFQQNVGLPQIIASGYTLCWAAKWYDKPGIMFDSLYKTKKRKMLKGIHSLLDEAEAVVHYNGTRFDVPTLNKEFIIEGMKPPSPSRPIDLLQTARRKFRFTSNKLDYVAQVLGEGHKVRHKGHELWIDCMADKPEAWATMERYNKHDVALLERVYKKMLPWIINHPNHGAYDETLVCTNCGGDKYQARGYRVTRTLRYRQFQCQDCGAWFRENKTISERGINKFVA